MSRSLLLFNQANQKEDDKSEGKEEVRHLEEEVEYGPVVRFQEVGFSLPLVELLSREEVRDFKNERHQLYCHTHDDFDSGFVLLELVIRALKLRKLS